MSEKGGRKDKNQNIQVFVRLRPLNQRERDIRSVGIIDVVNNSEVVVKNSPTSTFTKKFTFDRAFGPNTSQVEVYQNVVSPLIEEVLAGYNCTVFAYGQTGTGKTHTMVGENTTSEDTNWQNDPQAGIIPRSLSQLFDELRISNTEYTVRVSYLELYNEELFDLLSNDDNSKLRIYEDVTRKGSNIVNGLEEITVHNKNEVYQIMAQGQERKRVASTQMNAQSSRSHTVFTIVVHMKEISPQGEELVKIGKLNLVDLAGSENISKAGTDNPAKKERARESVNINQSLLTLGRVITALVERHPHIPYRESKLTRILQESLGGRTKTSIIATISPGHKDLEETMSTLEYAHRAKNIQNKPEVNQKMTKRAILREYAEEIDKLKRDLQAARDKSGVYLSNARFEEMVMKEEEQRKEIQELLLQKKAMEDQKCRMEAVFQEMEQQLRERQAELDHTHAHLQTTKEKLFNTKRALVNRQQEVGEQRYLVGELSKKEQQLRDQAQQLVAAADTATDHVSKLHDSIDKRRSLEATNLERVKSFRSESGATREQLQRLLSQVLSDTGDHCSTLEERIDAYAKSTIENQGQSKEKLQLLTRQIKQALQEAKSLSSSNQATLLSSTDKQSTALQATLTQQLAAWKQLANTCLALTDKCCSDVSKLPLLDELAEILKECHSSLVGSVRELQQQQKAASEALRSDAAEVARDVAALTSQLQMQAEQEQREIQVALQEIEAEKQAIETRLNEQLQELESEREDTRARLNGWLDERKKRLQEERRRMEAVWRGMEEDLDKLVETEIAALDQSLSARKQYFEQEKQRLVEQAATQCGRQMTARAALAQGAGLAARAAARAQHYNDLAATRHQHSTAELDQGIERITTEISAMCERIPAPAAAWRDQLLAHLHALQQHMQKEASESLSAQEEICEKAINEMQQNLHNNVQISRSCMNGVTDKFEECSVSSVSTLSSAGASCGETERGAQTLRTSTVQLAETLRQNVGAASQQASEQLVRQADNEQGFVENFRLYQPTGATPARAQYSYPRILVERSPNARVLQRYKENLQPQAFIELDSDASHSGSESSLSADSSPLSPPDTTIFKSASEADLHSRKFEHNQSKENPDRSFNFKRPSRLPAPTIQKNPLLERNGDK